MVLDRDGQFHFYGDLQLFKLLVCRSRIVNLLKGVLYSSRGTHSNSDQDNQYKG